MRILIYNSKQSNNNFHLTLSLLKGCLALDEINAMIADKNSISFLIKSFSPTIVIAFGGEEIESNFIRHHKRDNVTWILWTTEDPFELKHNQIISKLFDIVITSDIKSRHYYQHPRCYYLPLAGDTELFYRKVIEDPSHLKYDLIFVGTAWPNRSKFLVELLRLIKKHDFRSRFIMPSNLSIPIETVRELDLENFERNFRVSPEDLATFQNLSAFTLTLFRDFSADGKSRPQSSPSNRFYETALAGTGQIIACDEFEISKIYPDVKGYVFQISSAQDIIDLVMSAKNQDYTFRNNAATKSQDFVVNNHLYKHRVKEILDIYRNFIAFPAC